MDGGRDGWREGGRDGWRVEMGGGGSSDVGEYLGGTPETSEPAEALH